MTIETQKANKLTLEEIADLAREDRRRYDEQVELDEAAARVAEQVAANARAEVQP